MVRYCGPTRRTSRPRFGLLPWVKKKCFHVVTLYIYVDFRASWPCTKTKKILYGQTCTEHSAIHHNLHVVPLNILHNFPELWVVLDPVHPA